MRDIAHEKTRLLYELGFITARDRRIPLIQKHLQGKNDIQADNWMRDIILGEKTLDEALKN